jgi:vancomycin resistance protein YoaR
MTTLDEVLAPAEGPSTVPRKRLRLRLVLGFLVGFVLVLGIAAGALVAYDAQYDGRILPGVHAGGVDLSGLDRDGAAAALGSSLAGYGEGRLVVRTVAGDITLPYREFSRRPDVDAMIDAAMGAGRAGGPLDRAVAEVRLALDGTSLEPRLVLDEDALRTSVTAALARLDQAPIDSRLIVNGTMTYATTAWAGRRFDGAAAAAAALEAVRKLDAPAEVVIEAPATEIAPARTMTEVNATIAAADRLVGDVVVSLGDERWTIKAATVRRWIHFDTGADGSTAPVVDETAVAGSLTKIAKAVKADAVSAKYLKTRGGTIVGVVGAKNGRRLDVGATAARIANALASRAGDVPAAPVAAVVTTVAPKLSTAEAVTHGPLMTRLGSWKTWFPVSERNYFGANIWLPARIIDGTVLRPGQRFEWWSAIGPVTTARGFGPGGFIAGDHTDPTGALGGGMCSSSTTLFNAALRAGLQMGARSNHRYYISRYPLGLDATVSKTRTGGQTMSFTNDMDHPIVIRTFRYRSGGKGWVRYEIWGIPDGRQVAIGRPQVSNVRKAITQTVIVSTLRHGVRKQTEFPANGMDVSVTRVVRDRNGGILHRDTYGTHYTLWNGRIEIGR